MGYILLYKPVVESILTSSRNKPRRAVVSNVDLPVEMWHRATNFDSADEHYKQQNNCFRMNVYLISFENHPFDNRVCVKQGKSDYNIFAINVLNLVI